MADQECQQSAIRASLGGASWKALISNTGSAARTRLTVPGDVVRLDNVLLARGAADFWDGTLAAPLNINQHGSTSTGPIWTGSLSDGQYDTKPGANCSDWQTKFRLERGIIGDSSVTDSKWINSSVATGYNNSCESLAGLYCIEQSGSGSNDPNNNNYERVNEAFKTIKSSLKVRFIGGQALLVWTPFPSSATPSYFGVSSLSNAGVTNTVLPGNAFQYRVTDIATLLSGEVFTVQITAMARSNGLVMPIYMGNFTVKLDVGHSVSAYALSEESQSLKIKPLRAEFITGAKTKHYDFNTRQLLETDLDSDAQHKQPRSAKQISVASSYVARLTHHGRYLRIIDLKQKSAKVTKTMRLTSAVSYLAQHSGVIVAFSKNQQLLRLNIEEGRFEKILDLRSMSLALDKITSLSINQGRIALGSTFGHLLVVPNLTEVDKTEALLISDKAVFVTKR